MNIGELCTRETVCCRTDSSLLSVAQLMREHHVGDIVVVVEESTGAKVPVGIITDRDLVIEVLAKAVSPSDLTAKDLLTEPLVKAREDDAVYETIERMQAKGIRRVPVVNSRGALVGILTLDDISEYLTEELTRLSKIAVRQQRRESKVRA
jgi:CBS domain-containing protein